ncbi:alpha/beta hydrolase [Aureimonas flava]|uniref:Alpha/beta hydrolase n=1 Tax=Aureimonas flava TaxID=2320271 RepID=A0A3A1WLZ7_9HYPH|nr:alpha/beta hydrolase [Aureimonas flava]RIY01408.1 alpha/beta hydrolase [Aureimonas flava]
MSAAPTAAPGDRGRATYDLGRTAIFSCRSDPRFSYCLYVPPSLAEGETADLMVAVHGTGRTSFLDFRDGLSGFGRWNRCAILCPLFPVGVLGDGARSGYKYMAEGDIRYDRIVLDMVAEVAEKYGQDWSRFAMFGFSGGGHFTHRFAILHPDRLWAASVGAPGSVTLLDPSRDWWVGIRDLPDRFGIAFDADALARVPVQMVVGDADLETWEITHREGSPHWMEGANEAGRTRPERLAALKASFETAGVAVRFDLVPGVSHDRMKVLDRVEDFLGAALARHRRERTTACA